MSAGRQMDDRQHLQLLLRAINDIDHGCPDCIENFVIHTNLVEIASEPLFLSVGIASANTKYVIANF